MTFAGKEVLSRLRAIAFTDSVHEVILPHAGSSVLIPRALLLQVLKSDPAEVKQFIRKHAVVSKRSSGRSHVNSMLSELCDLG